MAAKEWPLRNGRHGMANQLFFLTVAEIGLNPRKEKAGICENNRSTPFCAE
jgi:hypothetical protein